MWQEEFKLYKLKDVTKLKNGYAFKSNQFTENEVPIIRINNLQNNKVIIDKKICYPNEFLENNKQYEVKMGDILISMSGSIGKISRYSYKEPSLLNQRVGKFEITEVNKLDREYLFYFLRSDEFQRAVIKDANGCVVSNISAKNISDCSIPVPSLEAQKKIVKVLKKAEDVVEKRKQAINLLDELVKSQFIEMFGDPKDNNKRWEIKKLGDIYKVGSSKRIYQREQTSSGIPFLRISDLVKRIETGNNSCELYISEEQYNSFKAKMLVPLENDILVTSRGTLGLCYIVKEKDKFYFQDGMISWLKQIDVDVDPIYITTLFSMNGFRKQIDEIPTGTTVNYLSIARLANLEVMYPNIKLQNEFSNFVKQVEKLKFKMEQSLKGLENNFNSLMKDSFSGNLSL